MCKRAGIPIALTLVVFSLLTDIGAAQGKQTEAAPIPSQIASAKRVFIANGGGDEPNFQDPCLRGRH